MSTKRCGLQLKQRASLMQMWPELRRQIVNYARTHSLYSRIDLAACSLVPISRRCWPSTVYRASCSQSPSNLYSLRSMVAVLLLLPPSASSTAWRQSKLRRCQRQLLSTLCDYSLSVSLLTHLQITSSSLSDVDHHHTLANQSSLLGSPTLP